MTDQRIEKWTGWVEGTIKDNVLTMHLQRQVWREASDVWSANPDLPESYWWEFMRDTYATTQAVAVRRQADTMKGVASLGKLIKEISDDPAPVTYEFWMTLNADEDPYWVRVAENNWAEHYGGAGHDHLDGATAVADLERLVQAAARVRHYVDKHVAHAEASPPAVTLTLDEVHDTIDTIGHLFKKYSFLLTGNGWGTLEPAIQHPWQAVFAVPWMVPRSA